jgi:rare lipoprotein A (peptidoglycan hydrolase)
MTKRYHQQWICVVLITAIALGMWGCTASPKFRRDDRSKPTVRWVPPEEAFQIGMASYYGPKFHGRPTSSGEIFDMYKLTAAHNTLPLGTVVKVTHLANNKSVVVKVNDRGPFIGGRILDLSYGAAQELDMIQEGVARVRIDILEFGTE